jgi:hypothetical protein
MTEVGKLEKAAFDCVTVGSSNKDEALLPSILCALSDDLPLTRQAKLT